MTLAELEATVDEVMRGITELCRDVQQIATVLNQWQREIAAREAAMATLLIRNGCLDKYEL